MKQSNKGERKYLKLKNIVSITPFDSSSLKEHYILELRSGDKFVISKMLYDIIFYINKGKTFKETAEAISRSYSIDVKTKDIEQIIDVALIPKISVEEKREKQSFSMLFSKTLIPNRYISPISEKLSILMSQQVSTIILLIAIFLHALFYATLRLDIAGLENLGLYEYFFPLTLIALSSFVHEIGHTTTLRKYSKRGEVSIGIALYWTLLVFYADVREAWYLKRRQRVMVDAAGIYFQFIFCSFIIILFMTLGFELLAYTVLVIHAMLIWALHPFLKFDGYWIVSDALGIPNLHKRTKEYLLKVFLKRAPSSLLEIGRSEKPFFKFYIFGAMVFSGFVGYYLLIFLPNFILGYPEFLRNTLTLIVNGLPKYSFLDVLSGLIRLFFFSLPFLAMIFLFVSALVSILKIVKEWRRSS